MRTNLTQCVVFAAITLFPSFALANCKQGFCVSGQDRYGDHIVDFSSTIYNVHHYNVKLPNEPQKELGSNERQFSFPITFRPWTAQYSIQACQDGGTFQRSVCSPWVTFTHSFQ